MKNASFCTSDFQKGFPKSHVFHGNHASGIGPLPFVPNGGLSYGTFSMDFDFWNSMVGSKNPWTATPCRSRGNRSMDFSTAFRTFNWQLLGTASGTKPRRENPFHGKHGIFFPWWMSPAPESLSEVRDAA
jgi:hypothetical protein